jgi:hypothetical protein
LYEFGILGAKYMVKPAPKEDGDGGGSPA